MVRIVMLVVVVRKYNSNNRASSDVRGCTIKVNSLVLIRIVEVVKTEVIVAVVSSTKDTIVTVVIEKMTL